MTRQNISLVTFTASFLLSVPAFSDTVYFQNGTNISGKIKNQNIYEIQLETEPGKIQIISKNLVSRVSYEEYIARKTEPPPVKKEEPPKPEKTEPEPMVYQVKKDNKTYLIDVDMGPLPLLFVATLVRGELIIPQEVRNATDKYFLLVVNPDLLLTGDYDLVIRSIDGKEISRKTNFVSVVLPEDPKVVEQKQP